MLQQIIDYIKIDMFDIFTVMPKICLYALLCVLIYSFFAYKIYENNVKKIYKTISMYALIVYLFAVIYITILSREPGSRIGTDFRLFGTFVNDSLSMSYVVENLLMMMPLGILLPIQFDRLRRGVWQVLIALIFSCSIELCQYFTECGYFQVDDIWLNVAGCFVMSILFNIIRQIGRVCNHVNAYDRRSK